MYKLSTLTAALAVALFIVPTAQAQDSQDNHSNPEQPIVQPLPTMVVTASRSAQPIERAIGDITVIDGVQLRQNNDANILRRLAREPGIQMYDSGGPHTTSGIAIRGGWGGQNLIMINGIRINDNINIGGNNIPWGTLNPRAFERVEVVRGAASSLWGSSAMGGVVNLVTEVAPGEIREFSPYADIGFGSDATVRTGAGFSGADGTFDYNLSAQYARSDGYNATTKDNTGKHNPDDDGYEQHSLSGSFGWTWAPEQRLGVHFFNSYLNGDYDDGSPDFFGAHTINRLQAYGITSQNKITKWWQSTIRYGFQKTALDDRTQPGTLTNRSYQNSFSWQNDFFIHNDHTLSLFYEGTKERITSTSDYNYGGFLIYEHTKAKRNTNAVGAIYQGHFLNRHHIQASIRNDHFSDYGSKTTGSLAYDFDLNHEFTIGVAANTGFRMPSFLDLYGPDSWGSNPNLKPEKSRNVEAHLTFSNESTTASIRGFDSRYKDLITSKNRKRVNLDKAKIRGISLYAAHEFAPSRFGTTSIYGNADFLSAKDSKTKERLVRRAKQVYRAGITHRYDRFEVGAEYMHIGSREDNHSAKWPLERTRLGGYGTLNLNAKVQLSKEFSAQVYWNNVFDKRYAPAHGYRGQGSNVFLNLSWQPTR